MKKYLDWIKEQPCCHCRREGCDPHHIIGYGYGRMGSKAPDVAVVPLCRACHNELHHTFSNDWIKPQLAWLIQTLDKAVKEGVLCVSHQR